jgi:hypothetical protein
MQNDSVRGKASGELSPSAEKTSAGKLAEKRLEDSGGNEILSRSSERQETVDVSRSVTVVPITDLAVMHDSRFGSFHRNEFALADSAVRYESWTIPEPLNG